MVPCTFSGCDNPSVVVAGGLPYCSLTHIPDELRDLYHIGRCGHPMLRPGMGEENICPNCVHADQD